MLAFRDPVFGDREPVQRAVPKPVDLRLFQKQIFREDLHGLARPVRGEGEQDLPLLIRENAEAALDQTEAHAVCFKRQLQPLLLHDEVKQPVLVLIAAALYRRGEARERGPGSLNGPGPSADRTLISITIHRE